MALDGEAVGYRYPDHQTVHSQFSSGVTIRPLRRGETTIVQCVFDQLGAHSRLLRFGGAKTDLSPAELEGLTRRDSRHHALVAFDGQVPIGIARLVRDAGEPTIAEIACAVADEWQGRGVGTALLEQLSADARAAGITRLRAFITAENSRSLAVLRRVATVIETRIAGCEVEVVAIPAA
jgi:GNAT superfamily N-acetyltransferase